MSATYIFQILSNWLDSNFLIAVGVTEGPKMPVEFFDDIISSFLQIYV